MSENQENQEYEGPEQQPVQEEPPSGPGYTENWVIVLTPQVGGVGATNVGVQTLQQVAGVSLDVDIRGGDVDPEVLGDPTINLRFEDLGIARVADLDRDQLTQIAASVQDFSSPLTSVAREPEAYVLSTEDPPNEDQWAAAQQGPFQEQGEVEGPEGGPLAAGDRYSTEYMQGYQAAVNSILEKRAAAGQELLPQEFALAAWNESNSTWGLQATKAAGSTFTGGGIKVGVLDTGVDQTHPDFTGRGITSRSFVPLQTVQDGFGHGTHCTGTACGPRVPPGPPGGGTPGSYGCAPGSEIFIGKVLNNQGSGTQTWILAGIQWALANGCEIVSMSLGFNACNLTNKGFNAAYQQAGQVALQQGSLLIAAAGNDSFRPSLICGIHPDSPAAAPSILGVGALDESFQPAYFSDAGLFLPHGAVNIAAPGVNVYSSFPRPLLYRRSYGTSMATPHVAGIAALWAEVNASLRGVALANQLLHSARQLPLPSRDVGAGLVQAP